MAAKVKVRLQVAADVELANKIARIGALNTQAAQVKDEGDALKAQVLTACGGLAALGEDGAEITYAGVVLANVNPQSRDNVSKASVDAALAALKQAHGEAFRVMALAYPEAAQALDALAEAAVSTTRYAVVRTK